MLAQLQQIVKSGTAVHAYLFLGDQAQGLENALEFMMGLNCFNISEGKPCGECLSCRKIRHRNHPDVLIMEPKGTSFKIEQVRELQKKVSFHHYEGRFKAMILLDADKMTNDAANSLLKTLEEPPSQTIFILIAENQDSIIPTVSSRCQVINIPTGEAALAADFREINERMMRQAAQLIRKIKDMDAEELFRYSDMWEKSREELKKILELLISGFRDIAVHQLAGKPFSHEIWQEELLNSSFSGDTALLAAEEVQSCQKLIFHNANMRLAMDVLLLKLQQLAEKETEVKYGESSWGQV